MAHLTRPTRYDIEDSNIALLGSDLEVRVREEAGEREPAWNDAGQSLGTDIWRIEQFKVVPWPQERHGSFYDGDSYIILHTYKKTPNDKSFSYNLHFWLGQSTTQDEAGAAAYKTVELDDHLQGRPVQFREVQNSESTQFLSYFPQFVSLKGGVATGFHHVSAPPPADIRRLYRVNLSQSAAGRRNLVVREINPVAESLVQGDVYVLDKGTQILQLNSSGSAGQERFKAAEFVRSLADAEERKGRVDVVVYDEGSSGATLFLREFGENVQLHVIPQPATPAEHSLVSTPIGFRISDESGTVIFQTIESFTRNSLKSDDVFLVDNAFSEERPAIYIWVGIQASIKEKRRAIQLAQRYLYDKRLKTGSELVKVSVPIVKVQEGYEPADFFEAL